MGVKLRRDSFVFDFLLNTRGTRRIYRHGSPSRLKTQNMKLTRAARTLASRLYVPPGAHAVSPDMPGRSKERVSLAQVFRHIHNSATLFTWIFRYSLAAQVRCIWVKDWRKLMIYQYLIVNVFHWYLEHIIFYYLWTNFMNNKLLYFHDNESKKKCFSLMIDLCVYFFFF